MSMSCSFDSVFDCDTLVFYIENNIQITSGSQPDQTHWHYNIFTLYNMTLILSFYF